MSQGQTLFDIYEEDKQARMTGAPTLQKDDQGRLRYSMVSDEPPAGQTIIEQIGESVGDFATAGGRAVVGGVRDMGQGLIELGRDVAGGIEQATGLPEGSVIESSPILQPLFSQDLPEVEAPKSAGEEFARGMTQFVSGFAAAPVRTAGYAGSLLRGGFADALFDPEQGNLSTFAKEMGLENELLDLLDSKVGEEASAAERLLARSKQTVEGGLVGVTVDGLVRVAKGLRKEPGVLEKVKGYLKPAKEPEVIEGAEPFTQVIFEVAPDPKGDPNLLSRWDSMSSSEKFRISDEIGREVAQSEVAELGASGEVVSQVGSYLDDTNPSFAVRLDEGDPVQLAKNLGFRLDQDSMMIMSSKEFDGSFRSPVVAIDVGDLSLSEVDGIYQTLRNVEGVPKISGQSTVDGRMIILLDEGADADLVGGAFDKALNGKYSVKGSEAFVSFPEKKDYDYGVLKNVTGRNRKSVQERYRSRRTETQQRIQEAVSGAITDTRAGRGAGRAYERTIEGSLNEDGRIGLTHYSFKKLERNDPAMAGTGADRTKRNKPSRGTWFGVTKAKEDPYRQEPTVGNIENRFAINPDELYVIDDFKNPDAPADPLKVWTTFPGGDVDYNLIMSKVKDAGYKGFIINSPAHGKVALIDDVLEAIDGGAE